jgi:erythromycin esterase-like protein
MSEADRFRKQADECREQAERAINPLDEERWLRLTRDWTKMAQDAEARYGK